MNGKLISLTNKKTITDMKGDVKYTIKTKPFDFMPQTVFVYDAADIEMARPERQDMKYLA